jgi:RNA recognition motif-containing protein
VGPLNDFYLKRQEDKPSFLFVEYASIEEADKAIQQCSGLRVADKPIFVKYAKPKADRRKEGENGGNEGGRQNNRGGDRFGGGGNREGFGGKGHREENGDRWGKGENQKGGYGKQDRFEGGNRGHGGHDRERKPFGNGSNSFGTNKVEQRQPVANDDFDY